MAHCANCGEVLTFDTLLHEWFDRDDSCRCIADRGFPGYHLPTQTRHTP